MSGTLIRKGITIEVQHLLELAWAHVYNAVTGKKAGGPSCLRSWADVSQITHFQKVQNWRNFTWFWASWVRLHIHIWQSIIRAPNHNTGRCCTYIQTEEGHLTIRKATSKQKQINRCRKISDSHLSPTLLLFSLRFQVLIELPLFYKVTLFVFCVFYCSVFNSYYLCSPSPHYE